MRLLDLFSGIGGFSYAAEKLVGGYETVAFCEQDQFCQQVLRKPWPNVPIYDDVRTIDATRLGNIDIVAGGFPCQAVSQAGLQKATEDDRWLWDEMLRIIQDCKPRWVIGENVVGLININEGVLFEQVQTDLEKEGYSVQSVVIPACAKNAPHRRDRVWIVGYSNDTGNRTSRSYVDQEQHTIEQGWKKQSLFEFSRHDEAMADSSSERRRITHDNTEFPQRVQQQFSDRSGIMEKKSGENVANTESINRYDNGIVRKHGEAKTQKIPRNRDGIFNTQRQQPKRSSSWSVEQRMGDVADGISTGLLRHFDREPEHIPRVTTGEKDRAKKLKALGNSIVPQVAAEIFNAIKVAEHGEQ